MPRHLKTEPSTPQALGGRASIWRDWLRNPIVKQGVIVAIAGSFLGLCFMMEHVSRKLGAGPRSERGSVLSVLILLRIIYLHGFGVIFGCILGWNALREKRGVVLWKLSALCLVYAALVFYALALRGAIPSGLASRLYDAALKLVFLGYLSESYFAEAPYYWLVLFIALVAALAMQRGRWFLVFLVFYAWLSFFSITFANGRWF